MKSRLLQEEGVDIMKEGSTVYTKWHSIWRGINAVMMVFFALATLANVNDSDWYIWMPIYCLPALLCLAVVIRPTFSETTIWKVVASSHFLVCLVYAVVLTVDVFEIMFGKKVNPLIHEEGREFFGLIIVMGWLAVCRFTPFGRSTSTTGLTNALLLMTGILALLPMVMWSLCMVEDWSKKFGHCNEMFQKQKL